MASSCVWFPISNPAYIIVGLGVVLCDASAVIQRKMYRVDTAYCVNANVGRFGISRDPEIAVLMHAMLRASEVIAATTPGALVLELLKAAYPCRTSQASLPLCGMLHAS